MIIYLLLLQLLVSTLYYVSAPFVLTPFIFFFWGLNAASVIVLLKNSASLNHVLTPKLKLVRYVFTGTLICLEIVINITSDSYVADNLHGFISDMEVLVTGITLGVLWYKELTAQSKRKNS